ncbi:hypothetical protein CQW23_26558 [Capsicum baccatum]|uniref:Uncharacterized protein n=1 Tax=Capsicum baccatum TaxID=33114 RepID=A0A2G2VP49_CAPBA|nr:hypothetical protein CQW23_26558 [Capsicum baccatum]
MVEKMRSIEAVLVKEILSAIATIEIRLFSNVWLLTLRIDVFIHCYLLIIWIVIPKPLIQNNQHCHLNIEFAVDSSSKENNGTKTIRESCGEYLNHNCDVKLNLLSIEVNGSLIVEVSVDANVSGFTEQNGPLNSSAFSKVTELSIVAKITGNG